MTEDSLLDLWRGALTCAAEVAAPFLIVGLVVGLGIAILQTATQLQESSLSFVPKLGVALFVLAMSGHWMLDKITHFTIAAFQTSGQPVPVDPSSNGEATPDPTP
jgi:flagellar biosynthetic protein FliQ